MYTIAGLALTPPSDEFIEYLSERGRADAWGWAETVGLSRGGMPVLPSAARLAELRTAAGLGEAPIGAMLGASGVHASAWRAYVARAFAEGAALLDSGRTGGVPASAAEHVQRELPQLIAREPEGATPQQLRAARQQAARFTPSGRRGGAVATAMGSSSGSSPTASVTLPSFTGADEMGGSPPDSLEGSQHGAWRADWDTLLAAEIGINDERS
jgi:hypothetical protein